MSTKTLNKNKNLILKEMYNTIFQAKYMRANGLVNNTIIHKNVHILSGLIDAANFGQLLIIATQHSRVNEHHSG